MPIDESQLGDPIGKRQQQPTQQFTNPSAPMQEEEEDEEEDGYLQPQQNLGGGKTNGIRIQEDAVLGLGAYGVWFKYGFLGLSVLHLLGFLYIFFVCFQAISTIYRGYFYPGTESCEWRFSVVLERFTHGSLVFSNILDLIFSFQAGQKYWGAVTLVTTVLGTVTNLAVLFISWITYDYIIPVNNPAYSVFKNPATSAYACGTTAFINSTASQCDVYNPNGYTAYPAVVGLSRYVHWEAFLWILMVISIVGIVKSLLAVRIPGTWENIKTTLNYAASLYRNVKEGGLVSGFQTTADEIKKVAVPSGSVVKASRLSFFNGWSARLRISYVIAFAVGQLFYLLLFLVFFTVFYLHSQNIKTKYTEGVVGISNIVTVSQEVNGVLFVFYIFVASNVLPLIFNPFLGNRRLHRIGMLSATFGVAVNAVLIIWCYVMARQCNLNGNSDSLCHDRRWKCQDPFGNPLNGCTNNYACTEQQPPRGPDGEFVYLYVCICWAFATNMVLLIIGWGIDKTLQTIKYYGDTSKQLMGQKKPYAGRIGDNDEDEDDEDDAEEEDSLHNERITIDTHFNRSIRPRKKKNM